jgi:nitrite reductase/ring-hydroxylating ferredoxin subunit
MGGEYHKIARVDDVPPGEARQFHVEDRPVALCNVDGEFYAFEDICTHQFAHLTEGGLEGDKIKCPLHGARFDVKTGRPTSLPAVKPVPLHEVKVEDGAVYVSLNEKRVKTGRRRRK